MSKAINNLKIGVAGVRGVIGESLSPKLISSFAAAFGQYIGAGPVIIGRDTRPSGIMVEQAVIAGLLSVGCQPILCGIIPTPTILINVKHFRAVGGIAITASHNPIEWNAMKFINSQGIFLNSIEGKEVLDIYNQENYPCVTEDRIQPVKSLNNAFDLHQDLILAQLNCKKIAKRKFKVAIDPGNGAASPYSAAFLRKLGCEVFEIHNEIDGHFRRKMEPTPDALTKLSEVVVAHACDIGFAQDPDADRLGMVDNLGFAPNENISLALATKHLLSRKKGPITINLATSKMLEDIATAQACATHYTKIGEIHVSSEILKNGSVIGGEANGGIIWPEVHPCRDSFAGMGLILEMMAQGTASISSMIAQLPSYFQGQIKLPCSNEQAHNIMRHIQELYAHKKCIRLDGLRLNEKNSWIIIRHSNTEPVIRIQAEAQSQQKLTKLLRQFEQECLKFIN